MVIEEYYPNALVDTYKGVSGYIYFIDDISDIKKLNDIPYAYTSKNSVKVKGCKYIPDAYEAILDAYKKGTIKNIRYEEFIKIKKDWLYKIIKQEYFNKELTPDYKFFLENKFKDILK